MTVVSDVTMPACALGAHPSPHRLAATRDAVRIPGMVITGSSDRDDARRRTRLTLVLCRKIVLWSTADGVIQGNRVNAILSNFRINWSLCTNQNCSVRAQAETIESKSPSPDSPADAGALPSLLNAFLEYLLARGG